MPVLKVMTNVRPARPAAPKPAAPKPAPPAKPPVVTGAEMGHPEGLLKDLSTAMTKTVGKPEAYIQCMVDFDKPIIFGGTEEPAAFADLYSIGAIGGDKNKTISEAVSKVLEEKLGIPSDRFYIQFHCSTPDMFGFKGSTFA